MPINVNSNDRIQKNYTERPFERKKYDICVVGAGLSGAVIAEQYASSGKTTNNILVIDKRNHIGGNIYDYIDPDTNIRVSQYGAHLFHTNSKRVWDYVQKFSEWTPYHHKVLGYVKGKYVPIPVNIDTVNTLFDLNLRDESEMKKWLREEQVQYYHCDEYKQQKISREPENSEEMAKSRVGERLYELLFRPYTQKQWNKDPSELLPEVLARIPVRSDFNDLYFPTDKYQALPTFGYTKIIENMLSSPQIEIHVNTDYFSVKDEIHKIAEHVYFTGPIDAYFAQEGLPKLDYRSLRFEQKVISECDLICNDNFFQPAAVVNHPSSDVNFTRIVEYKHFLNQPSPKTIIFYEYPSDIGEPYYPVPNDENKALYEKYQQLASSVQDKVTFVGRLANYKYFNMDQAILNALNIYDEHAKNKKRNNKLT